MRESSPWVRLYRGEGFVIEVEQARFAVLLAAARAVCERGVAADEFGMTLFALALMAARALQANTYQIDEKSR